MCVDVPCEIAYLDAFRRCIVDVDKHFLGTRERERRVMCMSEKEFWAPKLRANPHGDFGVGNIKLSRYGICQME